MLSIVIPTYNYPLLEKVKELQSQCKTLGISYEILCQDDASKSEYNIENEKINLLENCSFVELNSNVAHRQNRNLLAAKAQYPYLLFIDGDSNIIRKNYIEKYLENIQNFQIIYGGRIHPEKCPSENQSLRWKYGREIEDKKVQNRIKKPYESLLFNNTLIEKKLFDSIQFDKTLVKYGHDDTQLAFALKNSKASLLHIDNPVEHGDIDTNEAYLSKVNQSLEVLMQLYREKKIPANFNKMLSLYAFLKKTGTLFVIKFLFKLFRNKIKTNLLGNNPRMLFLTLYKLGYFCLL